MYIDDSGYYIKQKFINDFKIYIILFVSWFLDYFNGFAMPALLIYTLLLFKQTYKNLDFWYVYST